MMKLLRRIWMTLMIVMVCRVRRMVSVVWMLSQVIQVVRRVIVFDFRLFLLIFIDQVFSLRIRNRKTGEYTGKDVIWLHDSIRKQTTKQFHFSYS
jgi:hypothetical protein